MSQAGESITPEVLAPVWKRRVKIAAGIAVSALFLGLIATRIDVARALASIRAVSWHTLTLATLMLACGYAAKIARWHVMLVSIAPRVPWTVSTQTLLASVALNNVLPLRAGDVARVFAFRKNIGASAASILPLLVLERLLDTAMLVVLAAVVTIAMQRIGVVAANLSIIAYLAAAAFTGVILLTLVAGPLARHVSKRGDDTFAWLPHALRGPMNQAIGILAKQLRGRQALALFVLTALAWIFEGAMLATLAGGFGFATPVLAGYFACALATLATLVPSAPGFFGTFHAAAIAAVSLFGAQTDDAAAFAFLAHGLLWLPLTICGLACLAFLSTSTSQRPATGTS